MEDSGGGLRDALEEDPDDVVGLQASVDEYIVSSHLLTGA